MITYSEFGQFEVRAVDTYSDLYLVNETDEFHIGWVSVSEDSDSSITRMKIIDIFIKIYLHILRSEIKLSLFAQVPTSNKFKDAVLRMQIEKTGQTFDIRPFAKEWSRTFAWRTYPDISELYSFDGLRDKEIVFRCPYGLYFFDAIDLKNSKMTKRSNGSESILSEIYIPYNDEDPLSMLLSAKLQASNALMIDINDQIQIKKNEMIKHASESLMYIFGFDKLRLAMRSRALS